ncbi:putative G-protein coupled receptor 160 [Rhinophrynus dorsalis]
MNRSYLDTVEELQTYSDLELLEPSCILIMIMTGKIIMNIFLFGARQNNVHASFLGTFCVSLALVDFALLAAISAIHCFQDFAICGIRFTNYHICLFTQIISHAYGILHYPVFFMTGLDYYLCIVRSVCLPKACCYLLYIATVLLLWITAFFCALYSSVPPYSPGSGLSSYQCTFYISSQTYYLSAAMVVTIFLVLAVCCFEVVAFIKSLKVITYANKTVLLFTCGNEWPVQGTKRLLTALVFSFLGTWLPFVLLQIIILILCAHIPGYMDMNVPWLYFMNSFLVGMAYSLKYPHIQLTENAFSIDPFISWKYCVLPFTDAEYSKVDDILNEQSPTAMII